MAFLVTLEGLLPPQHSGAGTCGGGPGPVDVGNLAIEPVLMQVADRRLDRAAQASLDIGNALVVDFLLRELPAAAAAELIERLPAAVKTTVSLWGAGSSRCTARPRRCRPWSPH